MKRDRIVFANRDFFTSVLGYLNDSKLCLKRIVTDDIKSCVSRDVLNDLITDIDNLCKDYQHEFKSVISPQCSDSDGQLVQLLSTLKFCSQIFYQTVFIESKLVFPDDTLDEVIAKVDSLISQVIVKKKKADRYDLKRSLVACPSCNCDHIEIVYSFDNMRSGYFRCPECSFSVKCRKSDSFGYYSLIQSANNLWNDHVQNHDWLRKNNLANSQMIDTEFKSFKKPAKKSKEDKKADKKERKKIINESVALLMEEIKEQHRKAARLKKSLYKTSGKLSKKDKPAKAKLKEVAIPEPENVNEKIRDPNCFRFLYDLDRISKPIQEHMRELIQRGCKDVLKYDNIPGCPNCGKYPCLDVMLGEPVYHLLGSYMYQYKLVCVDCCIESAVWTRTVDQAGGIWRMVVNTYKNKLVGQKIIEEQNKKMNDEIFKNTKRGNHVNVLNVPVAEKCLKAGMISNAEYTGFIEDVQAKNIDIKTDSKVVEGHAFKCKMKVVEEQPKVVAGFHKVEDFNVGSVFDCPKCKKTPSMHVDEDDDGYIRYSVNCSSDMDYCTFCNEVYSDSPQEAVIDWNSAVDDYYDMSESTNCVVTSEKLYEDSEFTSSKHTGSIRVGDKVELDPEKEFPNVKIPEDHEDGYYKITEITQEPVEEKKCTCDHNVNLDQFNLSDKAKLCYLKPVNKEYYYQLDGTDNSVASTTTSSHPDRRPYSDPFYIIEDGYGNCQVRSNGYYPIHNEDYVINYNHAKPGSDRTVVTESKFDNKEGSKMIKENNEQEAEFEELIKCPICKGYPKLDKNDKGYSYTCCIFKNDCEIDYVMNKGAARYFWNAAVNDFNSQVEGYECAEEVARKKAESTFKMEEIVVDGGGTKTLKELSAEVSDLRKNGLPESVKSYEINEKSTVPDRPYSIGISKLSGSATEDTKAKLRSDYGLANEALITDAVVDELKKEIALVDYTADTSLTKWQHIRAFCFKYIGSMFMESKNGDPNKFQMSLGRVLLTISSLFAIYVWVYLDKPIQTGMSTFIMTMAGYVFGTKAVGVVKSIVTKL